MMQQTLVPVLLLAAVALSSSNGLPMISNRLDPDSNDNIFSSRYSRADNNNIFYTITARISKSSPMMRKLAEYFNANNYQTGGRFNDDVIHKEDNYDIQGFRKKQWHNYPRQLDRLHEYLTHYHNGDTKSTFETDDPDINYDSAESKIRNIGDTSTNEYLLDSYDGNNIYDTISVAPNPLLILKVQLAYLSNNLKNMKFTKERSSQTQMNNENETNDLEYKIFKKEMNPSMKVKREGTNSEESDISDEQMPGEKKTKRLFSLWSRLQSLSHKGHELPHRRHLAAFYGIPGGDGGGKLTAETRASMMRPPGSPLRWG